MPPHIISTRLCILLTGLLALLSSPARAQDAQLPATNGVWGSPDHVILACHHLTPGAYAVILEIEGEKVPTEMVISLPEGGSFQMHLCDERGARVDLNGDRLEPPPLPALDRRMHLRPGTRYWIRRVGADPAEDIGDGQGSPGIIRADAEAMLRFMGMLAAMEDYLEQLRRRNNPDAPLRIDPSAYDEMELKVFKNSGEFGLEHGLHLRKGFGAGTTMTLLLDPDQAAWNTDGVFLTGDGADLDVDAQRVQLRFTEDWDIFEDRTVGIEGLGLQIHPDNPWLRVTHRTEGVVNHILSHTAAGELWASFGDPTDVYEQTMTIRVDGVQHLGDIDGDDHIDVEDLVSLLRDFGSDCTDGCPSDTNEDRSLDVQDIITLLMHWRP